MRKNREEIVDYINTLKGYQGYVQFSHRPIDKEKDIFIDKSPKVENENGFVYEAHFYNGTDSITIKQINDDWLVDEVTNRPLEDTKTYIGINNLKIKMAQIWEEEEDLLCELEKDDKGRTTKGFKVKKLKKVVFAGFEEEQK